MSYASLTDSLVKRWVKLVLPILPAPLRRKALDLATRRRLAQARKRKQRTQFSVREVAQALDRLRFSGDVILHSSISNIGKLTDGTAVDLAAQVLSRLDLKAVTLLAPALPFTSAMTDYLDQHPSFDVRTAKNAMGAIANIVMQQEGCLRSVHPTHSTLALGRTQPLRRRAPQRSDSVRAEQPLRHADQERRQDPHVRHRPQFGHQLSRL